MVSVERERLKRAFGKKGIIALVGLVAGLILLVLPTPKEEQTPLPESGVMTSAEYCAMLEQKAERLICELPEVDDCVVVITLERGYRHVYASDMHVNEYSDGKETDKTVVLAGNGSGEAAIPIEETMPTVAGVAVVCKNASYETRYRIIELMCALFDVSSNRISVQA